MPYIKEEIRQKLNPAINQLVMDLNINGNKKGNLNYAITMLILSHLDKVGVSYDTLNDFDGIVSDIEKELYRRITVPYEIKKIKENGDLPLMVSLLAKIQKSNSKKRKRIKK